MGGRGRFSGLSSKSVDKSVLDKGHGKYLGLPAVVYARGRLTPLVDSYLREGKARRRLRTLLPSLGPSQVAWEARSWLTQTSSSVLSSSVTRPPSPPRKSPFQ